ncbi:microsomal signal peptidase 12kDa subunit [Melanogaster broomeanus]|nr:microsomal signal peptidase 12kDa subunit [Melanogaster broomeanus]
MTYLQDLVEGKIDFHGEKKADDIVRIVLISSTVFSFVLGFALGSLRVTMGTFALSTLVLSLVVLPPWPMYNKHPVKWLPAQESPSKTK